MEILWNSLDKNAWCAVARRFGDANIYQHWDYGRVHAGGPGRRIERVAARRDGQVLAMAQVMVKRIPFLGQGAAEVEWGPVCRIGESVDERSLDGIIAALAERFVKGEGLTLSIRPRGGSAVTSVVEGRLTAAGFVRNPAARPYRTYCIDLSRDIEDIRSSLKQSWRRHLNKCQRQNLSITAAPSAEAFACFESLYWDMWKRKRFLTGVRMPHVRRMQASLPDEDKIVVTIAYAAASCPSCGPDGRQADDDTGACATGPVGAHCAIMLGDTCLYYLGATSGAAHAARLDPGYLLHWNTVLDAKARGMRYYDLGGIDPHLAAGVTGFKAGMSGLEVRFPGQYDLYSEKGPSKLYFFAQDTYRRLRVLVQTGGSKKERAENAER